MKRQILSVFVVPADKKMQSDDRGFELLLIASVTLVACFSACAELVHVSHVFSLALGLFLGVLIGALFATSRHSTTSETNHHDN